MCHGFKLCFLLINLNVYFSQVYMFSVTNSGVSLSHGFGWVSHRFMCLTVTDLGGPLKHSCVSVIELDGSLIN